LIKLDNIPTDIFKQLLQQLLEQNWKMVGNYDEFDAWIDYAKVELSNNERQLICEWDNWSEGSIEGHDNDITQAVLLMQRIMQQDSAL